MMSTSGGVAATPIVTAVAPLQVTNPVVVSVTQAWNVTFALAGMNGALTITLAV
jgi:hypothetical protein